MHGYSQPHLLSFLKSIVSPAGPSQLAMTLIYEATKPDYRTATLSRRNDRFNMRSVRPSSCNGSSLEMKQFFFGFLLWHLDDIRDVQA